MTDWRHAIHIGPEHAAFRRGEIDPRELGRRVAAKVRACPAFRTEPGPLAAIVRDFEAVSDIEEYDSVLARLYEWGDARHRCWIDTFKTEPTGETA